MKRVLSVAVLAALLAITVAIGVGTYLGYRWYTDTRLVSVDRDGAIKARVVRATLYGRSELRVGRLSGIVQGASSVSRAWGWLNPSQVVKAPFTADYFVDLGKLDSAAIRMSRDGAHFLVQAPDPVVDRPNVDMGNAGLNDVSGLFVTRSAYRELAGKVAASAQTAAWERARQPENMNKVRGFARGAIRRLFEGALRAARVDADVQVVFPSDPQPTDGRQWDRSRSIEDVLRDPR